MSMWQRIKRVCRSAFGAAVDAAEDPEMILKQNIRDLEDQVPKMNESIAMVQAQVTLLEKDAQRLEVQERELTNKARAALKANRRDIAMTYATQLEQVKQDRAQNQRNLQGAEAAYDKAMKVKEAFMRTKQHKVEEAKRALQSAKRAEWQAKVADAMESFQVGGGDQTHDEMLRKLDEKSALNEAKLEMALTNVDTAGFEIEAEAKKLEANETLLALEAELGMGSAPKQLEHKRGGLIASDE